LSLVLLLLPVFPACCLLHSDTDTESGQTDGSKNFWQSSSLIQMRKAFLSLTDSAVSCRRRLGFVSKHDIKSTDRLEINVFMSSSVHDIVTLSTQKTRFLRIFLAAVIANLVVDLPKTVGARRLCVACFCWPPVDVDDCCCCFSCRCGDDRCLRLFCERFYVNFPECGLVWCQNQILSLLFLAFGNTTKLI